MLALAATGGGWLLAGIGRAFGRIERSAVLNRPQAGSYLQKIPGNGASLRITCPGD